MAAMRASAPRRPLVLMLLAIARSPCALGANLTDGAHTLLGQRFVVSLPTVMPAPVLLLLHGYGDTHDGAEAVDLMQRFAPAVAESHVLVAPQGKNFFKHAVSLNDRDAGGVQTSVQFNMEFVAKSLVDHVTTFDNVIPTDVRILGFSIGGHLTNDILISNDDERITHAVMLNSQLSTDQFHDDSFFTLRKDRDDDGKFLYAVNGAPGEYPSSSMVKKDTLVQRDVLQLVGGEDHRVPAEGSHGESKYDWGYGQVHRMGRLPVFISWGDSAYAYAKAYGYTGKQAAPSVDNTTFGTISYDLGRGGRVVSALLKDVGHDMSQSLGCTHMPSSMRDKLVKAPGKHQQKVERDRSAGIFGPSKKNSSGRHHKRAERSPGFSEAISHAEEGPHVQALGEMADPVHGCLADCCDKAEAQDIFISCCKRPTGAALIADFLGIGADGRVDLRSARHDARQDARQEARREARHDARHEARSVGGPLQPQ